MRLRYEKEHVRRGIRLRNPMGLLKRKKPTNSRSILHFLDDVLETEEFESPIYLVLSTASLAGAIHAGLSTRESYSWFSAMELCESLPEEEVLGHWETPHTHPCHDD